MNFCSHCGHSVTASPGWPKTCPGCARQHYRNPTPVVVVLVSTSDGVVVVRRGIPPGQGQLALPGGYIERDESWQSAACREVYEETAIRIEPAAVRAFDAQSVEGGLLLLFCIATVTGPIDWSFRGAETEELVALTHPTELAFPTHSQALETFLKQV